MLNKIFSSLLLTAIIWQNAWAKTQSIDASTLKNHGIKVLDQYHGTPKKNFIGQWKVELPEYQSVIYFSTDGKERFLSAANRIFSWSAAQLSDLMVKGYKPDPASSNPSRHGLITALQLKDGTYLVLHGLAGPETLSYFTISDYGTLTLNLATFGKAKVQGDFPLYAWSKNESIHEAFAEIYETAAKTKPIKNRFNLRSQKSYPEAFEYLGWASWEQYRRKINSDLLVDAAKVIEKSDIPVRWFLVDDGHQDQTGSELGDSQLLSFNTNKTTFKDGFAPLMAQRSEKIRWMSIWHAMNGHWQGLHPNHLESELKPYLQKSKRKKGMLPKNTEAASQAFYDTMIGRTVEQGFDFVKIDNQNRVLPFYLGTDNAVEAIARNAQSLERAVHEKSQGLINCFAVDLISIFNTKYSNVSRVSVDYLLNNEAKAKSHLYQSYQNTLWAGQAVWPDHDMFHSSDKISGRMMAVSKAMSGAPIYLSDAPREFVSELITPLIYHDGKLIRPTAPAAPLSDSVMLDAMNETKPYRVIAPLPHGAAAIVNYNLKYPTPKLAVAGFVNIRDYNEAGIMIQKNHQPWKIPAEGLVYFDWYAQKGGKLIHQYDLELDGFTDNLVQLSPIKKGWSVIGRTDKFLSAASVKKIRYKNHRITVTLFESGPIAIYSAKKPVSKTGEKIERLGQNIWKVHLPNNNKEVTLTLSRT